MHVNRRAVRRLGRFAAWAVVSLLAGPSQACCASPQAIPAIAIAALPAALYLI